MIRNHERTIPLWAWFPPMFVQAILDEHGFIKGSTYQQFPYVSGFRLPLSYYQAVRTFQITFVHQNFANRHPNVSN